MSSPSSESLSAKASAPTPPAGARRKPLAGYRKQALLAIVVIAIVIWLGRLAVHAYYYEETDDAYVTGHIDQVGPQIQGKVKEVRVVENQKVKAGEVLVVLDPAEFEIARQKAAAGLVQARAGESQTTAAGAQADAQLAEARARVAQAGAQISQAEAQLNLARLTVARDRQLMANGGAVTRADVDNAQAAFDAAQAALDAATANRTAAQAAVGSAQAAVNSATAQAEASRAAVGVAGAALNDAQRQLSYTQLTAPADGRVGNKAVEVGNYVLPGQILLSLAEPDPWIIANFKETQLPRMRPGQDVQITVDAIPEAVLHGRVDSVSPASGSQFALLPADNATGNFNKVVQRFPVKITLPPETLHEFGDRLRLGSSVIVNVRVR